jgi:hypothetical protein
MDSEKRGQRPSFWILKVAYAVRKPIPASQLESDTVDVLLQPD